MLTLLNIIVISVQPTIVLSIELPINELTFTLLCRMQLWGWQRYLFLSTCIILLIAPLFSITTEPYIPKRARSQWSMTVRKWIGCKFEATPTYLDDKLPSTTKRRRYQRATYRRSCTNRQIMAMSLLACAARQLPRQERSIQFDTDSAPIGIDN